MIISIVNSKGGSAKTTTAVYLATAFSQDGLEVAAVDIDAQGSLADWAERGEDFGDPLPFPVEISNAKRLEKTTKALSRRVDVVVIDTPPGSPQAIDAAIEVADFIVVPTRSYGIEVARVWETLPSLEGKAYAVLITSARLGTKSLTELLGILDEESIPRFRSVIPLRESVPATFGSTPTQFEGYESVAREIKEKTQ